MGVEDIRDLIARLATSTNALLAVGLALQARVDRPPTDAALTGRIADVLAVLGVRDIIGSLSESDSATLLAGIRTDLFTAATALRGTSPVSGWTHVKADLLQSAGDVSAGFPRLLLTRIAPQLEGLVDRLASPDAAFLDVGVGVAALSIAHGAAMAAAARGRRRSLGAGDHDRLAQRGKRWTCRPDRPSRSRRRGPFRHRLPSISPGSQPLHPATHRLPGSSSASPAHCARAAGCFSRQSIPARAAGGGDQRVQTHLVGRQRARCARLFSHVVDGQRPRRCPSSSQPSRGDGRLRGRSPLTPLPVRLGLLAREGVDAGLRVLALDGAGHEVGGVGVGLLEVHRHVLVEHRLARRRSAAAAGWRCAGRTPWSRRRACRAERCGSPGRRAAPSPRRSAGR